MTPPLDYTPRERFWLCALAAFGLIAANGAFIYGLLFQSNVALLWRRRTVDGL